MPAEQLDLLGGSTPAGPPRVPPVIFHLRPFKTAIHLVNKPQCGHCLMTWHAIAERPIPDAVKQAGWGVAELRAFRVLRAIVRITQIDGSTLDLCVQHAKEHQARGDQDG
jgi:hypothetical protein